MDEVTRVLIAARERITDPERWTQGALAEGRPGYGQWDVATCSPLDPCAARWCAVGALERAARTRRNADFREGYLRLERALLAFHTDEDACATAGVEDFNDSHDHAAVLALFDAAIRGK